MKTIPKVAVAVIGLALLLGAAGAKAETISERTGSRVDPFRRPDDVRDGAHPRI